MKKFQILLKVFHQVMQFKQVENPEEVDDLQTFAIAREIKTQIEEKLQYPGTIKVTVIRETRATDVAK